MAQLKQTCSVTKSGQQVTLAGDFTNRIKKNSIFMVEGDLVPYTVSADSTYAAGVTTVVLTGQYQGDTNTAAAGVFAVDFTYPDMIPTIAQGDVGTAAIFSQAMYRVQNMVTAVSPGGLAAYTGYWNDVKTWHTDFDGWNTDIAAQYDDIKSWHTEVDTWHGETLTAKTSAQNWASQDTGKVDGVSYSAKYYAGLAGTSATNASASAANASTSETNAGTSATLSLNFATSLTSAFPGSGGMYGAKKYAVDASDNAILAANWATSLTNAFSGSGGMYGARKYANDSATSASSAAASLTSATNWATQMGSEVVTGQGYSAKQYAANAADFATAASTSAGSASTSETNAATSSTNAQKWATSLVLVDATNYGAKKYANDATTAAALAQAWASQPSGVVNGTSYNSAAYYAQQAAAAASAAISGQIQSNWGQLDNTQKDYIRNKPALASVATSGSYNDLLDKPATISTKLSAVQAADAANTIYNGGLQQTWQWDWSTILGRNAAGLLITESAPSTYAPAPALRPALLSVNTLAGSTAHPFKVSVGGLQVLQVGSEGGVTLTARSNAITGVGAGLLAAGGSATADGVNGGDVNFTAGNPSATATTGNAGSAIFTAGSVTSGSGTAGDVKFVAGTAVDAAKVGKVVVSTLAGTGDAGSFAVKRSNAAYLAVFRDNGTIDLNGTIKINGTAFATVATSGSYADLLNKPAFATVATSGAYTDLTGKPTIPSDNAQLANGAGFITAAGAPVQSVAGKTGAVVLAKTDVGLANVDNTSDVNKPVSTATQMAINGKLDLVGGTIAGSINMGDNVLYGAMHRDCGLVTQSVSISAGGTTTVDYTQGSIAVLTPTTTGLSISLAFSNWPPTGNEGMFRVDAMDFGNQVVSIPGVIWTNPNGSETNSLSTHLSTLATLGGRSAFTSGGLTKMVFWSRNAGTTVYGKFI